MSSSGYRELAELLATQEGEKAFIEWVSHPMTLRMLTVGRELSRPRELVVPGDCSIAYGECLGANRLLDFFANPTGRVADRMRGVLPRPRYGAPDSPGKGEEQ